MTASRNALVTRLSRYDSLVEVGVGRRADVAAALADAGKSVVATDVVERAVPDGVRFVRDDIVERGRLGPGRRYRVDAIYGLNLPPELHRPALDVARQADATFLFTTLGYDQPAIPVRRETHDEETVFVGRERE